MRTIAIINLKGGVAKTTSSINIAYILSTKGKRVLLVDNDKQGDCSRGMNRRTQEGAGIDKIMVDKKPDMASLIQKTDYENLDVITANLNLLTANMEVAPNLSSFNNRISCSRCFCVLFFTFALCAFCLA